MVAYREGTLLLPGVGISAGGLPLVVDTVGDETEGWPEVEEEREVTEDEEDESKEDAEAEGAEAEEEEEEEEGKEERVGTRELRASQART